MNTADQGGTAAKADLAASQRRSESTAFDAQKKSEFRSAHGFSLAFLLVILCLHTIGIFLFTNGFLLTRLVLEQRSYCLDPPVPPLSSSLSGSIAKGCWHPKSFDKAVVLIVDALRYDFTVPFNATSTDPLPNQYHDALTFPYETASKYPNHAVLRPFIADAPTTTLQRLKGLTTGTLPTFIDAGSNFGGDAIDEDNLIAQFRAAGKDVVHLGDDTWHALFPGMFEPRLTKPYSSFDVWDLFTVDNGVKEHLFPLLHPSNRTEWDVLIGHFLGVDHAGHTYGPDHAAMADKLREMDNVLRKVTSLLDHNTLLVVIGDHGMDMKGDHGGESDLEVEAAIWMYSKKPFFGREAHLASMLPPANAKERPIAQIDLVPTLALLLGIPVPFNNLGTPIDEAFIGTQGTDYKNLALVNRLAAGQIKRYQGEYANMHKPEGDAFRVPETLLNSANKDWNHYTSSSARLTSSQWKSLADAFLSYQVNNLRVFRSLWSQFDNFSMVIGILICLLGLVLLLAYSRYVPNNPSARLTSRLCLTGVSGLATGSIVGFMLAYFFPLLGLTRFPLFLAALTSCIAMAFIIFSSQSQPSNLIPTSVWGCLSSLCVVLLSLGFGANSFTIWEDETLLFFLQTFGILMFTQAFRLKKSSDRIYCSCHSLIYLGMIRLASLSRLCREEQMPYCKSTYYASAASSTSAPWQLAIPYLIAIVLPTTIKNYFDLTSSYQSSAPFWIGIAFRATLFLIAVFWTMDASATNSWLQTYMSEGTSKTVRMYLAQLVLMITAGAGVATFGWQSPLVSIERVEQNAPTAEPSSTSTKIPTTTTIPHQPTQIRVRGTNNLYGSHFAVLPFTVLLIPLLLLQKPMGQASLACTTVAIFSLLELLHLLQQPRIDGKGPPSVNVISARKTQLHLGPTILALMGHFTFFKTGHQATLASVQWESALLPLRTVRYPWAPLFLILNTFGGQILCAASVPIVVLWRRPFNFNTANGHGQNLLESTYGDPNTLPLSETNGNASPRKNLQQDLKSASPSLASASSRRLALLIDITKAYLTHILVYATVNLATTVFAAHLRRHLMLYRVFCPRWIFGGLGMLVAEFFGVGVGFAGVAWTIVALGSLFGWQA